MPARILISFVAVLTSSVVSSLTAQTTTQVQSMTNQDAETSISSRDRELIDQLFKPYSGDRPGAAVMIAKGDQLLFSKAYGLENCETKTPVTLDTNFAIGSVCKQFTAMAILKLIEDGKLELETKLTDVFSEFPDYGNNVTVFTLLTHQSGLPDYGPAAQRVNNRQLNDRDVLDYLITLDRLNFEPGERFEYSNSAYAILAEIVAERSGVPFETYMEREVFAPTGMTATKYNGTAKITRRATGHRVSFDIASLATETKTSAIKGDGSIYTSVQDFFKWHLALSNETLVSEKTLQQAYQPHPGTEGRYGFGWFMAEQKPGSFVHHGGLTSSGYAAYVARIPDQKITVAFFTNRGWGESDLPSQNLAARAEALLSIATDGELPLPSTNVLDDTNRWIGHTIRKRTKQNGAPAAAIGLIRDNEVKLVEGFGHLKRGGADEVSANSIFQIASVSKMFTGIIAHDLVNDGTLNLDASITKYLKDSISDQTSKRLRKVKVKHLLQHRSGIPHRACSINRDTNNPDHKHWQTGYSEDDLLHDINQIELEFEPGTKFAYTSSGYAILGYLCEIVSERSYQQLLESHITKKYGLADTAVLLSSSQLQRVPIPYDPATRDQEGRVIHWGKAAPPSGVFSSVKDLTKLMRVHIQSYQQFSNTGQRSTLILTDHPQTDNTPVIENDVQTSYGFGMFQWVTKTGTEFGHSGDNDGYSIFYEFNPVEGNGIVVMTSSGGRWFTELGKEINARLNNRPYKAQPKQKSLAQAIFNTALQEGTKSALDQFVQIRYSDEYYLREDEMNNAGYALIQHEKLEEAIAIFDLTVVAFPQSWNAYDSLAEAYLKNGQQALGIKNYEKSIELNPKNDAAIEILNKIQHQ